MGQVIVILVVLIGMFSVFVLGKGGKCRFNLFPKMIQRFTKFQKRVAMTLKGDLSWAKNCQDPSVCPEDVEQVDQLVETDNKTGCSCLKADPTPASLSKECRCCFRMKKWKFLICLVGQIRVEEEKKPFTLFVTVDGFVLEKFQINLNFITLLDSGLCLPVTLPPPLNFLNPCFKVKFHLPADRNDFMWEICGKLKIGIFMWPLFNIYTKCFAITKSLDSMKLVAPVKYKDTDGAAKVVIKDPENFNAFVCLCNQKKEDAISGKAGRGGDAKPKEITDKINWMEAKLGQVPYLVLLRTDHHPVPVRDITKDVKSEFLKEALEEAEHNEWMDFSGPPDYDVPGASCGGVLLTADKVMTICACVRSFYLINKLKIEPDEETVYPFDIQATEIVLKLANPALSSGKYALDTDGNKMMADSICVKYIEKNETEVTQTSMIVMPFTPKIKRPGDIFVLWPPPQVKIFPKGPTPLNYNSVKLVASGLEPIDPTWHWKNSSGGTIDFDDAFVDFPLKKCDLTAYVKEELEKNGPLGGDAEKRLSGFCAVDAKFQLCDGEIGWPMVVGRHVVGLSALPVDCGGAGSTVASVFTPESVAEIEKYVGKGLNTGSPGPATTPKFVQTSQKSQTGEAPITKCSWFLTTTTLILYTL